MENYPEIILLTLLIWSSGMIALHYTTTTPVYANLLPFINDCGKNPKYCVTYSTSSSDTVASSVSNETDSVLVDEDISVDTDMAYW